MAMTLTEKILARGSGMETLVPEQIVEVSVDRLMVNDFVGPNVCGSFAKLGVPGVLSPDKILFCTDHSAPPATTAAANQLLRLRKFCREYGIAGFCDMGRHGISHQLMVENFCRPGEIAVGTDSHGTLYGGLGAFGCGITASDAAVIMAYGRLWLKVPHTVRVELTGRPAMGVTGKDIALHVLTLAPLSEFAYTAIEVGGEGLRHVSVEARFTIANMLAETGAKNVIVEADERTDRYMGAVCEKLRPDRGAPYVKAFIVDLAALEPLMACPHAVNNVRSAAEAAGQRVDQVMIGSCTNGRLEDLRQALEILEGRRVHENVRLIVVPASQRVMTEAVRQGMIEKLLAAGAAVLVPSCASCAGSGQGVIGDGEVCVSTTNRNFKGRMGSRESFVYLASPYTAAASAVTGEITDPRIFLR